MNFLKKIKNYFGDSKLCQNITSYLSGEVTIFCYHKVTNLKTDKLAGTPDEDLSINIEIFENQIKYLANNFNIIDPFELMDIEKLKSTKEKKVLITFDDGYMDNLENALPILKKYKTNAIIFITTNFIDDNETPWWDLLWEIITKKDIFILDSKKINTSENFKDKKKIFEYLKSKFFLLKRKEQTDLIKKIFYENKIQFPPKTKGRFLNKENIKYLSKENHIYIGAHTHYHQNLGVLNDIETQEEISSSKKILEDLTQTSINFFAYPYGTKSSYKKSDYKILKDNNFKLAFTTEFNNYKLGSHSPFLIPRMGLGNYNDNKSIRDKVFGLDSLIKKIY